MKVCFDKKELNTFNLEELKKMLDVQIKSEKFEGAAVIRDVIENRKKGFGLGLKDGGDGNPEIL